MTYGQLQAEIYDEYERQLNRSIDIYEYEAVFAGPRHEGNLPDAVNGWRIDHERMQIVLL